MRVSSKIHWIAAGILLLSRKAGAQSDLIPPEAIERCKLLLVPLDESFLVVPFPDGNAPEFRADDSSTCTDCLEDFPGVGRLGFTFTFFGSTKTVLIINSNGILTFGGTCGDCHPTALPIPGTVFRPNKNIIAPFWADADTTPAVSGLVYYKSEPHRFTVIWDFVGYSVQYSTFDPVLQNTFEVVLSDGNDPLVGPGNNVAFSYGDMQWTNSDHLDPELGGLPQPPGLGGEEPAIVGANRGNAVDFTQVGTFDHEGTDFHGPLGAPGGVSYLDGRTFRFSVATATGTIAGTVYRDHGNDCGISPGDEGLAGWVMSLEPGGLTTQSDENGLYAFNFLPAGSYTVKNVGRVNWDAGCPLSQSISLAAGEKVTGQDFGQRATTAVSDLRVELASEVAVPAFQARFGILFQNAGNQDMEDVRVELTIPAEVQHLGCDRDCSFSPGIQTVSWIIGHLPAGSYGWLMERVLVPGALTVGTSITAEARIFPTEGDTLPGNNVSALTQLVRGSYDPNEKYVSDGGEVPATQELSYLIDFQNVGTYYAREVVIRDTLDNDLDIATVAAGGSSHPNTFSVDPLTRELVWRFENINLVWQSENDAESKGFVSFTASPLSGLAPKAVIENHASIVFDFNAPVVTNSVSTRIGLPPVALAGTDQTVVKSTLGVTLDGTGSSDPDGDTLTFTWSQVNGPAVTLSNAHAASPTFTAPPSAAELTFELVVNDGFLDGPADQVLVHVIAPNNTPVADAGPDQTVLEGTVVTLDGSLSSDPDLDLITFLWEKLSGPAVTLSNTHAVKPTFTAPSVGVSGATVEFKVTVCDPFGAKSTDTVVINVLDHPTQQLASVEPASFWIGLKNSDDQGTRFDVRAELYLGSTLVAAGETRCIQNVTRNPDLAVKVDVPFAFIPGANRNYTAGTVFKLRVLTRIGTDLVGNFCGGHSNAVGLRFYYQGANRPAGFVAEFTPADPGALYLHSTGSGGSAVYFLDPVSVLGPVPSFRDSGAVKIAGGNAWVPIGDWNLTLQ